jgi:hypothetical protein
MSTQLTQKVIGTCKTDGSGIWTAVRASVRIVSIDIAYLDDDSLIASTFGELRAYFPTEDWDCDNDGLIYTDKGWMLEFRQLLMKKGFSTRAVEAIEYSEQGMQGIDYVSMDIGDPFIIECDKFMNFAEGITPKGVTVSVTALE